MSNQTGFLLFLPLLFAPSGLRAQTDTMVMERTRASDLLVLDSGQYHMSVSTEIATLRAGEPREAPGVIYVITAEEIDAAGARDLEEALTLVPGITLGRDVDDAVSICVRGNWAGEGKCLVMLNGVFLNELSYGTFILGQRISLGNVSRIEVISGPGSVVYGGFAALGVVNIITKDAREFEGTQAVVNVGTANGMASRLNAQVFGSYMIGAKNEITCSLSSGSGVRSTGRIALPDGGELDYGDRTAFENNQFVVALRTPRTRAQFFFNHLESGMSVDNFTFVQRDLLMDVEHTIPLGHSLNLTLRTQYRNQLPWNYTNDTLVTLGFAGSVDKRLSQLALFRYQPKPWIDLHAGLSAYTEVSQMQGEGSEFNVGGSTLRDQDIAVFGEAAVSKRWGNTSIGARVEKSTFSDVVMAPRFAWTKAGRHLHLKLLYGAAFKLPTLQNYNLGPTDFHLKNESTVTTEAEAGWRFGRGTEFSMNLFRVDIRNPIIYVYEDGGQLDNYINRDRAGTAGVEINVRHTSRSLFMSLCYGNYQVVRSKTALPEMELPAPYDLSYQGVPRHKVKLVAAWKASAQVSLETRIGWQSKAWTYQYLTKDYTWGIVEHPARLLPDLGVRYRPKGVPGLSGRIGLRNILGQGAAILSPYSSGWEPIPINAREVSLELHYIIGR